MFRPITSGTQQPSFGQPQRSTDGNQLHAAIMQNDMSSVKSLLNHRISVDQWKAALSCACRNKECQWDIVLLLIEHPLADLRNALDIAVEHDAPSLVAELMKRGCIPAREHLRDGSEQIRSLLWKAMCKRTLYPSGADGSQYTDLDRALFNDDHNASQQILKPALRGPYARDWWSDAVKQGRTDAQRALILGRVVNSDRSFRLLENTDMITDPGVWKMIKQMPYTPPKHRKPWINFNGKSNAKCRHIALHVNREQDRDPLGKFDYAAFQSLDSLNEHVSVADQPIRNLRNLATETCMVKNRHFGAFIARQLEAMPVGSSRQILVGTTNHEMNLGLRVKKNAGQQTVYVAKLHDPNKTTTHARMESTELSLYELQGIDAYIDRRGMTDYFSGPDDVCMMVVAPPAGVWQESLAGAVKAPADRMLTSSLDNIRITPSVMYHLLAQGYAGNLRRLGERIAAQPQNIYELLAAKRIDGVAGLYTACHAGHADVINAFYELLSHPGIAASLHKDQLVELLAARSEGKFTALFMASDRGRADVIAAFGKMLSDLGTRIPRKDLVDLLAARTPKGNNALSRAMDIGQADSIAAYAEILAHLGARISEDDLVELVAARTADGATGLYRAMDAGQARSVEAFETLLQRIPQNRRGALLADQHPNGASGLHRALRRRHTNTIRAFARLLQLVPENDRFTVLSGALAMKNESILLEMMRRGDQENGDALCELLDLLPNEPRFALLATVHDDSTMNLVNTALQKGNAAVLRVFGRLLVRLPAAPQADLLASTATRDAFASAMEAGRIDATIAYAEFGLFLALQRGQVNAAEAFGLVLERIPEAPRLALLAAVHNAAGAGIFVDALRGNDAEIIQAFGKLLTHFPAERRTPFLRDAATAALHPMLRAGHADAAEAFGEVLLSQIPEAEQRGRLLAPIHDGNAAALFRNALQNGETGIIRTFGKLTPHLAAERQAALLTDAASRALRPAIQARHVEAITAFAQTSNLLAPHLSPAQRKVLLNACQASHTERVLGIQGTRRNDQNYKALKAAHPEFYARFKNMKDALKG